MLERNFFNCRLRLAFLLLLSFFMQSAYSGNAQSIVKVACVGNSITYGAGIANREKNAYPAQLQSMLGSNYRIMNFGVSGTTLLKKGNSPYWNTEAYKQALESKSDLVFIKLGTNDSKLMNRKFYPEFESDYKALIQSFRTSGANPRIVLLLPVPSFLPDSNSIYDPVIKHQIIPRIQKVAYETGVEVIDLYSLFLNKEDLFPDKIHPSSLGATIIAKRLYEAVKLKEKSGYNCFALIKENKKISSFYGFECADFKFKGRDCKVVKPKKAMVGLPWVWRARFWGHEPQTDIALLERGFHLVYCDVTELFGNHEAIDIWDGFYSDMRKLGLSKKVALEGMSRGGVYVYNWAAVHPAAVACIYADAPVLDLKSWPGGKGKSKGSAEDWEVFKKDYGYKTDEDADQFKGSPLDKIQEIVKGNYPMLHVVGDADDIVPVAENTALFENKIKDAGGDITVVHKEGVGHHPHSLANPSVIVDFILNACGYKLNYAALATPGSEYRSGAGWLEGKDWWAQNDDINQLLDKEADLDVLFLGNSITQGTAGHRNFVIYKPGLAAFGRAFKEYKWECAGISGDKTQQVLWRLEHGNYVKAKPKVLVLTIGVNNFGEDTSEEIAKAIVDICVWTSKMMPATKLVLIGPLPAGRTLRDPYRIKYEKVQSILSKSALISTENRSMWKALSEHFILPNGDLNLMYYSGDGIHLTPKGYEVWAAELHPLIEKLVHK